MFQIVRKFARERPIEARLVKTYILSAKFGLIAGNHPLPFYDYRMTPRRAKALQTSTLTKLRRLLQNGKYKELFISVSRDYLIALEGYEDHLPQDIRVILSKDRRGRRQAELRDWLRGCQPQTLTLSPTTEKRKVRIRGVELMLSTSDALNRIRRALSREDNGASNYLAWYFELDGHQVAPKWAVSMLMGLPVNTFTTDEARRLLGELGIIVKRA